MKENKKIEEPAATAVPLEENKVQRNVDFNLKKEDLMLLILEGRKEVMEETISKLTERKSQLWRDLTEKEEQFKTALRKSLKSAISESTKKLVNSFTSSKWDGDNVEVSISYGSKYIACTTYSAESIGERGSAYIKQSSQDKISYVIGEKVTYRISINFSGKQYIDAHKFFAREPRPCDFPIQNVRIGDADLSEEEQQKMPEYKEMEKAAKTYGEAKTQLTELVTDYDLFSRNQSRAKASMIKEVLSRDEQGKALLENISTAAKGVKLLGN